MASAPLTLEGLGVGTNGAALTIRQGVVRRLDTLARRAGMCLRWHKSRSMLLGERGVPRRGWRDSKRSFVYLWISALLSRARGMPAKNFLNLAMDSSSEVMVFSAFAGR